MKTLKASGVVNDWSGFGNRGGWLRLHDSGISDHSADVWLCNRVVWASCNGYRSVCTGSQRRRRRAKRTRTPENRQRVAYHTSEWRDAQ